MLLEWEAAADLSTKGWLLNVPQAEDVVDRYCIAVVVLTYE